MKYTAAHWGAYQFNEKQGLHPFSSDPSPSRIGQGWWSAANDTNSRILNPAIRKGWLEGDKGQSRNEDCFVEVDWDEALDLAANEIRRVKQTYGNRAIFGGSYGWASTGRFHHAQSQLKRFLNLAGGFVSQRTTYSDAAAEILYPYILGLTNGAFRDDMCSMDLVAEKAELLLAFGGISPRTAQITSSGTSYHEVTGWLEKLEANAVEVVSVSPMKSDLPQAEWVSIRPGTDTALILALTCEIVSRNQHDRNFIEKYTSGWKEFEAYLLGHEDGIVKSAQWASNICDVPSDTILHLTDRLLTKPSMMTFAWALQRADHGEQPLWAGLALATVLGHIGKPGLGYGFGYGSTTPVGRPRKLIPWPSFPQGRNAVTDYIPVARIADMLLNPNETYTFDGERRKYPDTKLVYWAGGNPFHHHQDLHNFETAWRRPETVIVNDHSWTATARRADIVLPCTTPLEREDIMINRRDPRLIFMSRLMLPMGASLNDFEIFKRLAQRLGFEDAFTERRTENDWLEWLWTGSREIAQQHGFDLPDFEAFIEVGVFHIPDAEQHRYPFKDFIKNPAGAPLNTETGKFTLSNKRIGAMALKDCPHHPAWLEPVEWLGKPGAGQLHLISGQPNTRLHAQNDRGSASLEEKIKQREAAFLHPDTAKALGLKAKDIIRIYNDRGACLAGLRVTEEIRTDCISLPTGAWYDPQVVDGETLEVHGNPNVLTIDKGCSGLSQGNIAHTALVSVEKWEKPLPPLTIDKPPKFVSR